MKRYASASIFFFFNDTATTEIYTLSLHDALPISSRRLRMRCQTFLVEVFRERPNEGLRIESIHEHRRAARGDLPRTAVTQEGMASFAFSGIGSTGWVMRSLRRWFMRLSHCPHKRKK